MRRYILRRFLESVPVVLIVSVLTFTLIHMMPGGPTAVFLRNPNITAQQMHRLEVNLGLTKPLWDQYVLWMGGLLRGDWGYSYFTGEPVLVMIGQRLPNTLLLLGVTYVATAMIALPVGVIGAVRQYSATDHVLTLLAYFGLSMPFFWLALLLMILFSVQLHWLPPEGFGQTGWTLAALVSRARHLAMPVTVLTAYSVARWSRFLRSGMLETLNHPFIRAVRAKGVPERRVIYRHALRNAILPLLTVIGIDFGYLFGGAVVTETIFAWPGMGRLFFTALSERDFPVILGVVVLGAVLIIVANLLTDIAYSFVDPRIWYE